MRTFLKVPFKDNILVKGLGARWSPAYRSWYIDDVEDIEPFLRWMPEHLTRPTKGAVGKPSKPPKKANPDWDRTLAGWQAKRSQKKPAPNKPLIPEVGVAAGGEK